MRSIHGQLSDNQPIRRTLAEKQKQLRDLKETLASMKSHTATTLRDSVRKRIAQLEAEISAAPALKTATPARAAGRNEAAAGANPRRRVNRIRAETVG